MIENKSILVDNLSYRRINNRGSNVTIRNQQIGGDKNIYMNGDTIPTSAPFAYTVADDNKTSGSVKVHFRNLLDKNVDVSIYTPNVANTATLTNIVPFNWADDKSYYPKLEIKENGTFTELKYNPSFIPIDGVQQKLQFLTNIPNNDIIYISYYEYIGKFPGSTTSKFTNTVTVGDLEKADYTTVADAITFVNTQTPTINNRWLILVHPGTYTETTLLIIPKFTVLSGLKGNSTIIEFTNFGDSAIEMLGNSTIKDLTFIIDGNAMDIITFNSTADADNFISNCVFDGQLSTNNIDVAIDIFSENAIVYIEECLFIDCNKSITDRWSKRILVENCVIESRDYSDIEMGLSTNTAASYISNVKIYNRNNNIKDIFAVGMQINVVDATSNDAHVYDCLIYNCVTGIKLGGDNARIRLYGITVSQCTNGLSDTVDGTSGKVYILNEVNVTDCTVDLKIVDSDTELYITDSEIDMNKTTIDVNANVYGNIYTTVKDNQETLFLGNVCFGYNNSPSVVYNGSCPTYNGLSVFRGPAPESKEDSIDIIADVINVDTTVALFNSTALNECLYIGSEDFEPEGILFDLIEREINSIVGTFVVEIKNSSGDWVDPHVTANNGESLFMMANFFGEQQAMWGKVLFHKVQTQILRVRSFFWTKQTTLFDATAKYWVRVRIADTVTDIPAVKSLRIIDSATVTGSAMSTQYIGFKEEVFVLLTGINLFSSVAPLSGTSLVVNGETQPLSDSLLQTPSYRFLPTDTTTPRIGSYISIPAVFDRTKPVVIAVTFVTGIDGGVDKEINLQVEYSVFNPGDLFDGSASSTAVSSISPITVNAAKSSYVSGFLIYIPDAKNNSLLYLEIIRNNDVLVDTYTSYIDMINVRVHASSWRSS